MDFECWWCRRRLGPRRLHHVETTPEPPRPCCGACYADPDGSYRSVYPGGEDEEAREVRDARHLDDDGPRGVA